MGRFLLSLPLVAIGLLVFSENAFARGFEQIKQQGELRVLYWSGFESYLPRAGAPLQQDQAAMTAFAKQHGVAVNFIAIEQFEGLLPALKEGKGDVLATNLTVTSARVQGVDFTHPVAFTTEYLVTSKAGVLKSVKQLNDKTLSVQKGTAFETTAKGLQKAYPGLKLALVDSTLSTDDVLDRLTTGDMELTILDNNTLKTVERYRKDIKRSFQASGKRSIAWAVKKGNASLLQALNDYLEQEGLAVNLSKKAPAKNRWEKIKQDKVVRFVLRNNMASYFIWRGELHGFNYEIARHFADKYNIRYQIVVAPDHQAMMNYLLEDKADIALGFLTPTEYRKKMGIGFSRPYHYASEVVVARSDENPEMSLKDLNGRKIYARPSSSYWNTVSQLQPQLPKLQLLPVAETVETEELIQGVASKTYDLTVADSHILDLELTWRDDVQSVMTLGEPKGQSWAVNAKHKALLAQVNNYIRKTYRGLHYNVTYNKYFKNEGRILKQREDYETLKTHGQLSPYDDIVKQYAEQYDFDWRLLVSQMYQESRFNPTAKSWAGAKGLFQVMPKTAHELGVDDLKVPENGIKAGVAYMDWVRQRAQYMKPKDEQELMWFTLASYNAGSGHVRDAIRLAKQKGWKGNVWFGNVEQAMLLLSKKEYASKARYGYVRGSEPVDYVRLIRKRYRAYQHVTDR